MPLGDKSGPNGQGAMTGRRQGYCTGNEQAGYMSDIPGRGMGRGAGMGGGFGNGTGRGMARRRGFGRGFVRGFSRGGGFFNASAGYNQSPEDEARMLEAESKRLEQELEAIRKRRDGLNK
jgi:hypothetical protein